MKKNIRILIFLLILVIGCLYIKPDDKELFMGSPGATSVLRPNVVILMDNSGSMNTIIFYPLKGLDSILGSDDDGYNPNTQYAGVVDGFNDFSGINYLSTTGWHARWIVSPTSARKFTTAQLTNYNGGNYWTGCYSGSGTDFEVGSNSDWFKVGDTVVFCDTVSPYSDAVATITQKYLVGVTPWIKLANIKGGPITPGAGHFQKAPNGTGWSAKIVKLYGVPDNGQNVRYPTNYMRWLYLTATDAMRAAVTHFSTYGTFDVTQTPAVALSNCATPGNDSLSGSNPRIKQVFTRIQTAREVICKVAKDSNKFVKLGLFDFDFDNGGNLEQGLTDMSDESSGLVSYKNNVWDIYGSAFTPLAEALADIWYYIKPGPSSKTYWPVDYEIAHNLVNHSTTASNLVEWWCQNNYAVIMTDGESTKDRFDSATKYGAGIFKNRPVKRTEPWTNSDHNWTMGWGDPDNTDGTTGIPTNYNINSTYCPNYSCWIPSDGGSDYLDDVAYFIRHQDMFPDFFFGEDPAFGWPGDQNIYTYVIGFAADNHMLLQTAINGDGAYYTAGNYEELVTAFQTIITSINLRNFAFSSITAPKKSTTATNDELTVSYVGYFLPSATASVWEGHLLAHRLDDLWGFDSDGNGEVGPEEFVYNSELQCVAASNGEPCERWVYLNIGHEWDSAELIPTTRNLFTHQSSALTSLIDFNLSNLGVLKHLFGLTTTDDLTKTQQATIIINKINEPKLADIFHSDVAFVGPPPAGKQYLPNIDPTGTSDEKYVTHYDTHKDRRRVIYVGTNDGIMHMFYGDGLDAGTEGWGFIPDEVLPSMSKIGIESKHTYTVDGRIASGDVFFNVGGHNEWASLLCFGLRQGGRAYYALDISDVDDTPNVLWKFKNDTWSGESWGLPVIARVLVNNPNATGQVMQKWVIFLTGGFAFNNENPNDKKGKAIFMVDAGTGELLWMLGFDPTITYSEIEPSTGILRTEESGTNMLLTKEDVFNFSIPSSMSVVDVDGNGFIDTIYFANRGGHLFKTDTSKSDPLDWKTSILFKTDIVDKAASTISGITFISEGKYDILLAASASTAGFVVGDSVMGVTSRASGYITALNLKTISVTVNAGTFQLNERIVSRTYNPIYLSPSITYDRCYKLWVAFGTGDRDRPRTNPVKGQFILFKDNGTLLHKIDNTVTTSVNETAHLKNISSLWTGTQKDTLNKDTLTDMNGWYFQFPDNAEKLFDPEVLVLPDRYFNPRIYFNTYQPPVVWSKKNLLSPCDVPPEGKMTLYELDLGCGTGDDITGGNHTGRIAGGGIYGGKEYIMYEGTDGQVASVPGEDSGLSTQTTTLPFAGGIVFWKEKKR
ncbi:MAG TPA: PilC/PilY family type IV pilus protein [Candidatus Deferrimicrobium sp.]|nr:PilC/PilY family type IV pilus protein [Candidatus Deferrimicrobium sp.]